MLHIDLANFHSSLIPPFSPSSLQMSGRSQVISTYPAHTPLKTRGTPSALRWLISDYPALPQTVCCYKKRLFLCWQAQIAFLQGERKGQENLKKDLVRRIKMLEFALKQERWVPPPAHPESNRC